MRGALADAESHFAALTTPAEPFPSSGSGAQRRISGDGTGTARRFSCEGSKQSSAQDGLPSLADVPEVELVSLEDIFVTVEGLNRDGMQQLREGRQDEALYSLSQAQAFFDRWGDQAASASPAWQHAWLTLQADTTSNLGVLHRKRGDHDTAIRHLLWALKLHGTCGSHMRMMAATHLNLANCYLEVGKSPMEAARHAQAAVELGGQLLASAPEFDPSSYDAGSLTEERGPVEEDCAMLAVAYHKLAEAFEGLREWPRASHAYTQAYEVIRRSMGPSHHLTKAFEKSSRCPRRVAVQAPPLTSARLTTPRRLPSIPRARQGPVAPQDRCLRYELSGEVFQKWPPEKSTQEERQWYKMAAKR
mmetsp:Transcript_107448/g.272647  ORF Transcript_107448/g.272647 Transcript_107448/m.272647 type:complete len:361 (-) Transcript_107448:67-1149(-)